MDDSKYPKSRFQFIESPCPMELDERMLELLHIVEDVHRRYRLAKKRGEEHNGMIPPVHSLHNSTHALLDYVKYTRIHEENDMLCHVRHDNPDLYKQVRDAEAEHRSARMELWEYADRKRKERLRQRRKLFKRWYWVVRLLILCIRSRERANAPGGEGHKRARRSFEERARVSV